MFPDNGATVNATRELTFYLDSVADPDSLTPENIVVTQNGLPVEGFRYRQSAGLHNRLDSERTDGGR